LGVMKNQVLLSATHLIGEAPAIGCSRRFGRLARLGVLTTFLPALLIPQTVPAKMTVGGRTMLYAAVGSELTQYDLDRDNAALINRPSFTPPANVQEAWPHPSHKLLYVAWSNNAASYSSSAGATSKGNQHGVSAFRIDPASGELVSHGKPVSLPS